MGRAPVVSEGDVGVERREGERKRETGNRPRGKRRFPRSNSKRAHSPSQEA